MEVEVIVRNRRKQRRHKINNGGNGNGNGSRDEDDKINSLEWHMLHFAQPCEACHQTNIVHAFRGKSKKFKKLIRAHCETEGCPEKMEVISYVETFGADVNTMTCEVCNKEITVLESREKTANHEEAVYGICTNSECRERGRKFCYVGARVKTSVVEEEPIRRSSYPPLFLVLKQRRDERRAPYKNNVVKMRRQNSPARARV